MKTAILSDIHSNPTALLTVLKDIEQRKCDRIVCLGDIVGYGYNPNTCIDICRERGIECFLGNHDAGLISRLDLSWFNPFARQAIVRHRPLVSEENKKWLASLPYNRREGENAFAHGVYVPYMLSVQPVFAHFEYVNGYSDAALECCSMATCRIRNLFVGHTHFANAFVQDNSGEIKELFIDTEDETPIALSWFRRSIVNVGSVGYPRNQPYSIYGILDSDKHIFTHRLIPFDFDDYETKIKSSGAEVPLWIPKRKKQAEDRQIGYL